MSRSITFRKRLRPSRRISFRQSGVDVLSVLQAAVAGRRSGRKALVGAHQNDAIDEAFAALQRKGIVALQDAGGTSSMGWAEVNSAIADLEQRKKRSWRRFLPSPRPRTWRRWRGFVADVRCARWQR